MSKDTWTVQANDDEAGRTEVLEFTTEPEAEAFRRGVEWVQAGNIYAGPLRAPEIPGSVAARELAEMLRWGKVAEAVAELDKLLTENPRERGQVRIITANDSGDVTDTFGIDVLNGLDGLDGWLAAIDWAHGGCSWCTCPGDEEAMQEEKAAVDANWADMEQAIREREGKGDGFQARAPENTARELATVLAALRARQAPHTAAETDDIATDGGRFKPLTVEEIDELCERLNT